MGPQSIPLNQKLVNDYLTAHMGDFGSIPGITFNGGISDLDAAAAAIAQTPWGQQQLARYGNGTYGMGSNISDGNVNFATGASPKWYSDAIAPAMMIATAGMSAAGINPMQSITDKLGEFFNVPGISAPAAPGAQMAGMDAPWGVNPRVDFLSEGFPGVDHTQVAAGDPFLMEGFNGGVDPLTGTSMNYTSMPGVIPLTQNPAPVSEQGKPYTGQGTSGLPFSLKDAASAASIASALSGLLTNRSGTGVGVDPGLNGNFDSAFPDPTGAGLPPVVDPSVQAALDAAEKQRKDEEARAARKAANRGKVNEMFAGFDDGYYDSIADSYKAFHMPLLEEQAKEARRVLPFGTASTQSSAYQRQAGNLERDILRQEADVGARGVSFANQRRGEVANSRNNLLSLADSAEDTESITNAAADSAKMFGTPSPYVQGKVLPTPVTPTQFSPISDLFAKYTADAANGAIAQRAGYAAPTFRSPLNFSSGSAGRKSVTNVD